MAWSAPVSARPDLVGGFGDVLAVWPRSASTRPKGDVAVGGVPLAALAERFGTPLYVLDEAEVRARCRAYRAALPDGEVLYAAKAFLCRAMAQWIQQEGLGLAVSSEGELSIAAAAGFPSARIALHGAAKSPDDLRAALSLGVGRVVIDSAVEIGRLAALTPAGQRQPVVLRVAPGVAAGTPDPERAGADEARFGLSLLDGSALSAVARIHDQPRLRLVGLHCHLGPQIASTKPFVLAARRMVGLYAQIQRRHGTVLAELNLGGGHAVPYRLGDPWLDVRVLVDRLRVEVGNACAASRVPEPRLVVEPGRAIVGPSAVAVYRVLTVKRGRGPAFVAVDGGISDNPRLAHNGACHAPRLIGRNASGRLMSAHVVGRHCDADDVLAANTRMPDDTRPGDLLVLPVAGAYQLAMSSSYSAARRPPLIAVRDGEYRVLIRRETLDDLRHRDVGV